MAICIDIQKSSTVHESLWRELRVCEFEGSLRAGGGVAMQREWPLLVCNSSSWRATVFRLRRRKCSKNNKTLTHLYRSNNLYIHWRVLGVMMIGLRELHCLESLSGTLGQLLRVGQWRKIESKIWWNRIIKIYIFHHSSLLISTLHKSMFLCIP